MAFGKRRVEASLAVVAMIGADGGLFAEAADVLSRTLGPVAASCPVFPFTFTTYYDGEMGSGLLRTYFTFRSKLDESSLVQMKSLTSALEKDYFHPGTSRRRINLDPGILTPAHLVLASHKAAAHRLYLGDGVYAEIELIYERGAFRALPWTYPDYRSRHALEFFASARRDLLREGR